MNTAFVQFAAPTRPSPRGGGKRSRQRGISMFVVMIVLMLALILVLGGLSVTNMNESLVGNQSDAQRAYGSAQALLDAAQRDIRLNGLGCNAAAMGGGGTNPDFKVGPAPGADAGCTLRFPRSKEDYGDMVTGTPGLGKCGDTATPSIYAGVCISSDPADTKFAADTVNNGDADVNAQQVSNGANYNSVFLTALDAGNTSDYGGDAAVGGAAVQTSTLSGGTYWVEVFLYNVNSVALGSGIGNMPVPDPGYPFVFRITALAPGLKGSTLSVLRTYYTPYPMP